MSLKRTKVLYIKKPLLMSIFRYFSAVVLIILLPGKATCKISLSLQKAFDKHYITAKAFCNGGLELTYSVSNLLKDSLFIQVPAGWRFNSNAGKSDYQDILTARQQVLVLKPKETKSFNIRGYCCEASKAGPVQGVPYTTGNLADSSLVYLARYLNTNSCDENTAQYAVWAVSDRKETANITSKNDSLVAVLRSFVADIKGEPLPWYTLLKKAYVTPAGSVYDYPVRFKADVPYSVTQTCYSYCYLIDAKGQTVSEILGTWLYPEMHQYKANFNAAGLKKGVYRLVLENKKETLFEKSFLI